MAGCAGMTPKQELHPSSTARTTSRILIHRVRSAQPASNNNNNKKMKQQKWRYIESFSHYYELYTVSHEVLCKPQHNPYDIIGVDDSLTIKSLKFIYCFSFTSEMVTKICTDSGHWFLHPESNRTWTNYTRCNEHTNEGRVVGHFTITIHTDLFE